jgi:hypothetical protein
MKASTAFVLGGMILLCTSTGCFRRTPKQENLLLAVVGDKKIRQSTFREELDQLDPSLRSKYRENRMAFLEKMIEEEVIHQLAVERNLAETLEAKELVARAREEAAIARLEEVEILSGIEVSQEEIQKRYDAELTRPEGSSLVRSVLYLCAAPDNDVAKLVATIDRGIADGLSFVEIAKQESLPYDPVWFDSPRFDELPPFVQAKAPQMANGTGMTLQGMPFYFHKDVEPLSACFRRIRQAVRLEKEQQARGHWLAARRAASAIQRYEEALDDLSKTDAVAATVSGSSLTVGEILMLLDELPAEERTKKMEDKKALLDEAIDRRILRDEAWKSGFQDDKLVTGKVERETRRILAEILTAENVTAHTPAAREQQRAEWLRKLKETAGIKQFPQNVKKMYIPPSKGIEDVPGGENL